MIVMKNKINVSTLYLSARRCRHRNVSSIPTEGISCTYSSIILTPAIVQVSYSNILKVYATYVLNLFQYTSRGVLFNKVRVLLLLRNNL